MKLIYFIAAILFISCSNWGGGPRFDSVIYEPKISRDTRFLNSRLEPAITGKVDSSKKASAYGIMLRIDDNRNSISSAGNFRCHAYLLKDTVKIVLENSNGFSGSSFVMNVVAGRVSSKSGWGTDAGTNPSYTMKIEKQELILNKQNFNAGDSIFGQTYFHGFEIVDTENKTEVYFSAHFRGRIN